MRRGLRSALLVACTSMTLPGIAIAQPGAQPGTQSVPIVLAPPAGPGSDINPTQRAVSMTVPLRESGRYLGDVVIEIGADDVVRVSSDRVFTLLAQVVDSKVVERARRMPTLHGTDLAGLGIGIRYNPQDLALDLELANSLRSTRDIQVSALDPDNVGTFYEPARVSAFLNGRTNIDYLHGDGGLQSPVVFLDGAARIGPIVAEGEGLWQTGKNSRFTRSGARLVYDDRGRLVRWTAGDLQTLGRAFQSSPEIAGLSVFRSYGILEPQRIARPRGDRAFVLTRPSTVEVLVNGQLVRRLQLEPGNYDLRDFPFTQGANNVRLSIRDDAGRLQTLNFNIFLDQSQLGGGLTEFGVYAGVLAATRLRGPEYSGNPAVTGFVRHGFNDSVTLGANFQGDRHVQMGGLEGIWSSSLGTFAGSVALSNSGRSGFGHAAVFTFQRLLKRNSDAADSLNLFFEQRSRNFSVLGTVDPLNPFAWEAGGGYSRAFGTRLFAGVDGRYSRGRGEQIDAYSARGTAGYRLSSTISLAAEGRWEKDNFGKHVSALLTLNMRIGRYSNLRADYDTRFDHARLSYSTYRGYGVGSYNLSGDLDHSDAGTGFNVTGNYLANRGEIGASHYGVFDNLFGSSISQRSSVRLAGSLAFADGSFSVGRPIYDSFAIVQGHKSLDDASIEVERTPFGYVAETGRLGTAVHPTLASYFSRTVTVDAPEAPVTADLGQGSFRVFPAYRSGYKVTVGSDYNVTAIGRLLGADGKPLPLASGTLRQVGSDDPHEVAIFTNREGRFGATGLAAGRWTVQMNDDNRSTFTITIARDAEGVVQIGEIKPASEQ